MKNEAFPYKIYDQDLDMLPKGQKLVINTINQYSFCIAEVDSEFKAALVDSNVLLPDGIGIVKLLSWVFGKSVNKIAGEDLFFHLVRRMDQEGGKCFFLGSSANTLDKIYLKMRKEYPSIKVGCFSPPFKDLFDEEDTATMINAVNDFEPDILFVGMTAPKQEKWVQQVKGNLNVGTIACIGAVFDFYAGTVVRPGQIWINLGLEWFVRMVKEPRRMWKRYLLNGPVFFGHLLKLKFSHKINRKTKS
jgi:N-acetylglucosaminyldiphosphoundecaprenol N-acetyl-beta-D-mannosaminyltransferase